MKIQEAINKATLKLKMEKVDMPKQKARLLIQFLLKQTRQYVMVFDQEELTQKQKETYFKWIHELIQGIPLQHITGQQEFMKLNFYVNKSVLIPRPDTENLVEEVIEIAMKVKAKKILDLCTGSGAIAVALAKYIKNSQITATDISKEALAVAKVNAKRNGVDKQIRFLKSDLFAEMPNEKYDIIVSNPPYIRKGIIKTLDKEVQKEPHIALDGGYDGLDFYRKIVHRSHEFLKNDGYLCLEIGYDQKSDVIKIIEQQEEFKGTYGKKDLYGKDRVIVTRLGK